MHNRSRFVGMLLIALGTTIALLPGPTGSAFASTTALPLTIVDGTSGNNNGIDPILDGSRLYSSINANAPYGRSEVMWGDENTWRLFLNPGDVVQTDFDILPEVCGANGRAATRL